MLAHLKRSKKYTLTANVLNQYILWYNGFKPTEVFEDNNMKNKALPFILIIILALSISCSDVMTGDGEETGTITISFSEAERGATWDPITF